MTTEDRLYRAGLGPQVQDCMEQARSFLEYEGTVLGAAYLDAWHVASARLADRVGPPVTPEAVREYTLQKIKELDKDG